MKTRTKWKIAASVCLVAFLLPVFSALTPATAEAGTESPLPYAMEAFGQRHLDAYATTDSVTTDGVRDGAYRKLDSLSQGSSAATGIFPSNIYAETIAELATEYLPYSYDIYGCYDSTNLYLYFETVSRTSTSSARYRLYVDLGTNFGESSVDAAEKTYTVMMDYGSTTGDIKSGTDNGSTYYMKTEATVQGNDSTGIYDQNKTTYEVKIPWSVLGSVTPGASFDRLYFSTRFFFNGGAKNYYWYYGVSKLLSLPIGTSIGAAFTSDFGECAPYIPHVLNLLGTSPDGHQNLPEISSLTATTNGSGHNYTATYSVTPDGTVTEYGVLQADTAAVTNLNLVWSNASARHVLSGNGATYDFSVTTANDKKFISLRPYVKYSDGAILYGAYTTVSNYYYDAMNQDYTASYNILMIGCSFNYYYLDELIQIASQDGIKLNVCNSYSSGTPADSTWNWLIHDYTTSKNLQFFSHTIDNPGGTKIGEGLTLKECLAWKENLDSDHKSWDFISVQDHYGIEESDTYEECMEESIPYLPNTFRYLEATQPGACLLMHQTWAFQVGYTNGTLSMESSEMQAIHHENIRRTVFTISENMNPPQKLSGYDYFPVVPSGNAWALARQNPAVGDTLCNKGTNGTQGSGDNFHDGTTGGGQYLNACVWYEVITGNSCVGNAWRPSEYTLAEARVTALQTAAHQAVAAVYGTGYATPVGN